MMTRRDLPKLPVISWSLRGHVTSSQIFSINGRRYVEGVKGKLLPLARLLTQADWIAGDIPGATVETL